MIHVAIFLITAFWLITELKECIIIITCVDHVLYITRLSSFNLESNIKFYPYDV